MWDAARQEREISGPGGEVLVAALDADLAVEEVEPLVVEAVDVQRRAEADRCGPFDEGERPAGLCAAGLDVHPGVQEPQLRAVVRAQQGSLGVQTHLSPSGFHLVCKERRTSVAP